MNKLFILLLIITAIYDYYFNVIVYVRDGMKAAKNNEDL